jgi:hypothetical protein
VHQSATADRRIFIKAAYQRGAVISSDKDEFFYYACLKAMFDKIYGLTIRKKVLVVSVKIMKVIDNRIAPIGCPIAAGMK